MQATLQNSGKNWEYAMVHNVEHNIHLKKINIQTESLQWKTCVIFVVSTNVCI